jgi:hypothetical protein
MRVAIFAAVLLASATAMTMKANDAVLVAKESPFRASDGVFMYLWKFIVFHPVMTTLLSLTLFVLVLTVFYRWRN